MNAYWRLVSFETEASYDQVVFYGVNNFQYRRYSGEILQGAPKLGSEAEAQSNGNSERLPSTDTWYTLFDNEITFEFKADGSDSDYRGFPIFLMCKSK